MPREIIPSNWDEGSNSPDYTAITLLLENRGFLLIKKQRNMLLYAIHAVIIDYSWDLHLCSEKKLSLLTRITTSE